ncbi:MAG: hypothetical protein WD824_02065 [Cyclobacteriaceae bacterium]
MIIHSTMPKKKKKPNPQQPLSPKKYILTRARLLPIYKCLVNKNWKESKMASIIVTRKHSNDNITAGFFLVDMMARGVKDTHYLFNEPKGDFFETIYDQRPEDSLQEIPYPLAHNIIYGSVAFAEEHNFRQHPDFELTEYILEEDTDEIELIDLEFGVDGKPFILDAIHYDEDGEKEDPDEGERIEEFENYSDEDWKIFFNTPEPPDASSYSHATIVLFKKWLREKYSYDMERRLADLLKEIEITQDPINPEVFKSEKEWEECNEIFEAVGTSITNKEKLAVKERLHKMIAANPQNPIYHNYLALCAEPGSEFKEIVETTIKLFPDYLFGKLALANELMDDDKFEEAEKVFNGNYTLKGLYPDRKVFHVTELIGFNSAMMRIFLHKKAMDQAELYYKMIYYVGEEYMESNQVFLKAETLLYLEKIKIVHKYIAEKGYVTESAPDVLSEE